MLRSWPACLLCACATGLSDPRTAPIGDYHQHLVSPAFSPVAKVPQRDGAALVREMDAAGVDRAVVLSVAYSFGDERKGLSDPDRLTREENDWTSAQVVRNAPRLIGFCSANPLREAALKELERCLRLPGMAGIKQHFGNAGVSLRNPAHLARMQQVFALAQRLKVPLLVHMRARGGTNYGSEDARLFLEKLLPSARGVYVIVAHLGGSGPGYGEQTDEVMQVFSAAAARKDPRMHHVYFDVATDVTDQISDGEASLVAQRLRTIGLDHVLYGSDLNPPGGSILSGWQIFRERVPLTEAEFQTVMTNRLSFLR